MPWDIPVIGHGWSCFVNPQAFTEYLPTFSTQVHWSGSFNAHELEEHLRNNYPHFDLTHRALRDGLKSLFKILSHSNSAFNFLNDAIGERLTNLLNGDLYFGFRHANGLFRLRRRFVVLACLANYANSSKLANALGYFFYEYSQEILSYERNMWIDDWEHAISLILHLMDSRLRRKCEYTLSQRYLPDMHRGRRVHRRLVAPIQRGMLTAPPVGQLARSPAAYALAPAYAGADLQNLAMNQQVMMQNQYAMGNQLDNIENALVGPFVY